MVSVFFPLRGQRCSSHCVRGSFRPDTDEPRVVGAVPGTTGHRGNRVASSGAQRSPARPCSPVPAHALCPGAIACRDTIHPLQLTLPTGFDSWAQVLTGWRVSRAFDAVPLPQCFVAKPDLAAPFVAAISREICVRQLGQPPLELRILRESVVEPTFDRVGGHAYVELHGAMEAAQWRHFAEHRAECRRASSGGKFTLPAEVCRMQAEFFDYRRRNAAAVEHEQRVAARAYWKTRPRHGLADDFFADAASDSTPARMARVDPMWWWRSFFTRLQAKSKRHHAAEGRFLDALPSLRAQAKKKTLVAQIAEWSEAAAVEWGWRGVNHYRRFSDYADEKARAMAIWIDHRAPGYRTVATTRHALDERLARWLAEHDPHERLLAVERARVSEHWRN